jgi:ABC-type transport system involved in multi-copper enzyme maturation permease subunit
MNIPALWRQVVVDNPMLIEISRFRRKHFSMRGGSMAAVVLVLSCIGYAAVVLMVINSRGAVPPLALVMVQLVLLGLLAPIMLHGAVAGERERRSWDFLLVAPLTKAQIVVGKFLAGLAGLGTLMLLGLIPILVAAFSYEPSYYSYSGLGPGEAREQANLARMVQLVKGEMVCASFLMMISAMSMLFSARAKRSFTALGTTLGVLAVFFVIFPALVSALAGMDSMMLLLFHPAMTIAMLMQEPYGPENYIPHALWGLPQIGVYLFLTVVFVTWAVKTLVYAENEVPFLPKKESHA